MRISFDPGTRIRIKTGDASAKLEGETGEVIRFHPVEQTYAIELDSIAGTHTVGAHDIEREENDAFRPNDPVTSKPASITDHW